MGGSEWEGLDGPAPQLSCWYLVWAWPQLCLCLSMGPPPRVSSPQSLGSVPSPSTRQPARVLPSWDELISNRGLLGHDAWVGWGQPRPAPSLLCIPPPPIINLELHNTFLDKNLMRGEVICRKGHWGQVWSQADLGSNPSSTPC